MQTASPPAEVKAIAIRMADEGVPLRAIARCTKIPGEDTRELLHEAIQQGYLLEFPPEDWAPGSAHDVRPAPRSTLRNMGMGSGDGENHQRMVLMQLYKMTRLQAAVLLLLINRVLATKEAIHREIENLRRPSSNETSIKMVDVIICHVRKRTRPFGITIDTVHSEGYLLSPDMKQRINAAVADYMASSVATEESAEAAADAASEEL